MIAWFVIAVFGVQELSHAAPVSATVMAQSYRPARPTMDLITRDPSLLQVPYEHVMLKEIHHGTNGRLLIYLQDAHANLSGQKNLAGAMDELCE